MRRRALLVLVVAVGPWSCGTPATPPQPESPAAATRHKAIHPNVRQMDDGSVKARSGQPGGFVAADQ